MTPEEIAALTDEELAAELSSLQQEQARRAQEVRIPAQLDKILGEALEAAGKEKGEKWKQPNGVRGAYPSGWKVEHDGRVWTSLIAGNVWEPGTSGWRADNDPDGTPAEWVQPTMNEDAYQMGDVVTHLGKEWTSELTPNVWEPGVVNGGWVQTGPEIPLEPGLGDGDTELPGETIPDEGEPTILDWVQPTGAGTANPPYTLGAIVAHNGSTWTSSVDGNVWEPGVPGTWTKRI